MEYFLQSLSITIVLIVILIYGFFGILRLFNYIHLKANEGCIYKQAWTVEVELGEDLRYLDIPLEKVKELSNGMVIYPIRYKECN